MNDHERLCGQAVIDFANADSTDEACAKHFENMARIMAFGEGFIEKVTETFPSLARITPRSEPEAKCFELMVEEERIKKFLSDQFYNCLTWLKDYNYVNETVEVTIQLVEDGGFVDGKPDFSVSYDTDRWKISLVKEVYKNELGRLLRHDTFDELDKLMTIGKSLESMKAQFTEEKFKELHQLVEQREAIIIMHDELQDDQNQLRNVLDSVSRGVPFHNIPEMSNYRSRYSRLPQFDVIASGDFLSLAPNRDESHYLSKFRSINTSTSSSRLADDLTYCLITFFLDRNAKTYLHKCEECGKYFLAKRRGASRFCPDDRKCHDAWHNRQRIESGRAREYKKEGRSEGKYQ